MAQKPKDKLIHHQLEFNVTKIGKPFTAGTRVKFMLHKRNYTGVVQKQLSNSAIIAFDKKFAHQPLVAELKNKVVISYKAMALLK